MSSWRNFCFLLCVLSLQTTFVEFAHASGEFGVTSQSSTGLPTASVNTVDLVLSTREAFPKNQSYYFDYDFNVSESTIPTVFTSAPYVVGRTQRYLAGFTTTLNITSGSFSVEIYNSERWHFGAGFNYSDQTGIGTPNTYSRIGSFDIGKKVFYRPSGSANAAENSDFKPSFRWKVGLTAGPITADSYLVTTIANPANPNSNVSTNLVPLASLNQSSLSVSGGWAPIQLLSLSLGYQQFGYDADPNVLIPVKSTRRGSPTSLENFEDTLTLSFHLNDAWDLSCKGIYDVTATADQTISDEETYTLSYFGDRFDFGIGYDHQNSSGADSDSTIMSITYNWD